MRKTKIVATIGPATDNQETLQELADAGMDVARQNLSHGTHQEHREILERIRSINSDVAAMIDTKGPEVRTGELSSPIKLEANETVNLTPANKTSNTTIPIKYDGLLEAIEPGDTILIDDGLIHLTVTSVDSKVTCTVKYGGKLESNKSVTIPGKDIGLPSLTDKDKKDIAFGARHDFDFISASFIKTADDIKLIREIIEQNNGSMDIIAKIEHPKAVENFKPILSEADGIMVARGDLGVELPESNVPPLQKEIIKQCNKAGKPVITATQMLKSMTENPSATRAEVSDVANAVEDGTDAVMLSEETAIGKHPSKSVELMGEIAEEMEQSINYKKQHYARGSEYNTISDIICHNVWQVSTKTDVRHIVAHTSSGYTAQNIAKYRPDTDIIAFTNNARVKRKLELVWGINPVHYSFPDSLEAMIHSSVKHLEQNNMVSSNDLLVMTAGVPLAVPGTTNMMEVHKVKEVLADNKDKEKVMDRTL